MNDKQTKRPAREWERTKLCGCGQCWRTRRGRCPNVSDEYDPPTDAVWLWSSRQR